jgi:hypothetical protein
MTTFLAIVAPWIGLLFAIPAGIGLGWVYRKTSGPNDLNAQPAPDADTPRIVSEMTVGRKPKRTVVRRPKSARTAVAVQPESPDA